LASEYGQELEPINYIRGVAISGRLRLHGFAPFGADPAASIVEVVDPLITPDSLADVRAADGSVHAGFAWAGELSAATGDSRYAEFLIGIADRYLELHPNGRSQAIDPDDRVEEIFFASAILGRAYEQSRDARYAEALVAILDRTNPQPDTGLWWHCNASPFYWGRGNAFAALGFAEALSYLPNDRPGRKALITKHRAHLDALIRHQDASGAWRQVIDRPDSYLELTATSMIGYALMRGMTRGWLNEGYRDATAGAWAATAARIDSGGMVRDACAGTGPMPTLDDYINRRAVDGHDDRAGSMALWFAVEVAAGGLF
jgi:rhamnogalacturonyl hydrolase YesR